MLRLLLRPRWLGLALLVVVVAVSCVQLGRWQLHRLEHRRAANALIEANTQRPPVPAADLLAVGRGLPAAQRWRPVTATGRYDAEHELLVRNRTLGGPGYEVLTPLVTTDGTALLVDRGWVRAAGSARQRPDVPPPAAGTVTVTGRAQPSERRGGKVDEPGLPGQVGRIDVGRIAERLPYPVLGGYADLVTQDPPAGASPQRLPVPELGEGPHLAYATQWFAFAVMAVGGFVLLLRREAAEATGASPRVLPRQAQPGGDAWRGPSRTMR